jgi:G:T/U-mismatch repair DNA glycosylase
MEARQKQLRERLALARANEFQTLKSEINRPLRRQFEGGGSAEIREARLLLTETLTQVLLSTSGSVGRSGADRTLDRGGVARE